MMKASVTALFPLFLLLLLRSDPASGFSSASIPSFTTTTTTTTIRTSTTHLHYGQLSSDSTTSWNPVQYLWGSPGAVWTIQQPVDSPKDALQAAAQQQYDANLFWVASLFPLGAFLAYGQISHALAVGVDLLGFKGANVDGNAFATNLLRPTLNGVVGE